MRMGSIDVQAIGSIMLPDKLVFVGLTESNTFPRGWCSAQRIKIIMIAGGNHTSFDKVPRRGG